MTRREGKSVNLEGTSFG